jgi:glycosyltransferase involved in cell wall biosynthesis
MTGPRNGREGRFGPVLVRDVEISRGVPGIVGSTDGGRRYASARLLVRIHQVPIGVVSVPLVDGDASAEIVAGRVFAELGEAVSDHLAADGIPMPDDLPVTGLPANDDVPRCRRRLDGLGANAPLVSVVVCGGGRRLRLARCLRSVLKSSHPHFEILVVHNSPDASVRDLIAEEFANEPRIRHLYESAPGLSAARNTGLRFARGAVVAFTDDDTVVDSDWLTTLAAAFDEDERVMCVTGSVLPAELETLEQCCVDARRGTGPEFRRRVFDLEANRDGSPLYPYRLEIYGSGANMAWRKSALTDLWGFDLSLGPGTPTGAGEDLDAFLDVLTRGMKILHEPAALVLYAYDDDFLTLRRQVRRQAAGVAGVLTKRLLTDPRHRTALVRKTPTAVRIGLRSAKERRRAVRRGQSGGYPRELLRADRRGRLAGPFNYVRSRLEQEWLTA